MQLLISIIIYLFTIGYARIFRILIREEARWLRKYRFKANLDLLVGLFFLLSFFFIIFEKPIMLFSLFLLGFSFKRTKPAWLGFFLFCFFALTLNKLSYTFLIYFFTLFYFSTYIFSISCKPKI